MNLVTRAARKMVHRCRDNGSLSTFKADAHRANRAHCNRVVSAILAGSVDADDADFSPVRSHMVTAYEVD